jgi:hypothetical protein
LACQDNYIQLDRSTTARSGLYASDLPGVEISLLEGLTKEDHDDYLETWEMIYGRAWTNLVSDITTSLQKKFYVDRKLVSRETSKFSSEVNSGSGLAGIRIRFDLPKYARIHILSIGVFSEEVHNSPGINFEIYDTDETGELLYEQDEEIAQGNNTINIDRDFEANQLFIAYDRSTANFRKTENKYFPLGQGWLHFDKLSCMYACDWGGSGEVRQIEEGGLNVKYIVECSIDKFVCENINFFKQSLWYRIGLELTVERRFGNRLNEFTTMTTERATELQEFFNTQYQQALGNAIKSQNIYEDPFCFNCKNVVSVKSNLP